VEFYKRVDLVLRAVQRLLPVLPELQVLVVGEGAARAQLERQAAEWGLSAHVTFTGFVAEDTKLAHIWRAHAVVNTSEKEGWGLTVLEANACGLPAVASDVPGLRDAVRDGDTGVLVPHGDVSRLSEVLLRILRDDAYRQRLSDGAREWARRFTWDDVVADIAAVIEAVATRSPVPHLRWFEGPPDRTPFPPTVPAADGDCARRIGAVSDARD
jgi:glycosyltransferase involved in cell wall biosynthesis